MGLLDDAIREHLDLKRRRGADPSEIAREEAEALGPVRRDAPATADDVAAVAYEGGQHADHSDHEPAALDEPGAVYDDEYEDEPAPFEDEVDRLRRADPPTTHDAPFAEREDESATPPHGDPLAHQPTREFSATEVDEALGEHGTAAPPPGSAPPPHGDVGPGDEGRGEARGEGDESKPEDELEDTPDFLQETPEHDRLWFEQKPPKDFDF
jgi:hypothetical protein